MTISAVDLASLMCSRLCHDLLSPVGALTNGLELLAGEKDPEMRQRCLELLEQSAETSANKLKFFRLAFGAAGGFDELVDVTEAEELIGQLVGNKGRIELKWALGARSLPKPAIKMLLNLAAIGLEALPRGGTLDIGAESRDGASEIAVRAAGPKVVFDAQIGKALDGSLRVSDITSRTAVAHMLHLLADQCGGGLQFAVSEEALVMGAVLPNG